MSRYSITQLDHTADYYVKISADSLEGLMHGALAAVTSYCTADCPCHEQLSSTYYVSVHESSLEDLLIVFLNELLFAMETTGAFFFSCDIHNLSETSLDATLLGVPRDEVTVGGEIKAATYHGAHVDQSGSGYSATILFDV